MGGNTYYSGYNPGFFQPQQGPGAPTPGATQQNPTARPDFFGYGPFNQLAFQSTQFAGPNPYGGALSNETGNQFTGQPTQQQTPQQQPPPTGAQPQPFLGSFGFGGFGGGGYNPYAQGYQPSFPGVNAYSTYSPQIQSLPFYAFQGPGFQRLGAQAFNPYFGPVSAIQRGGGYRYFG